MLLPDQQTQIKGDLTNKKSEVSYRPAKKVTFIYNLSGEKSSLVFDTTEFKSIFLEDRNND